MLIYFGSRERTVGDWTSLLGKADARFRLKNSKATSRQANIIISVVWDDTALSEREADDRANSEIADFKGCTPEEEADLSNFK